MQAFLTTLNIVLPVFAIIGLGALLRNKGLVDPSFLTQTNRLLYFILLPLLLFYKIGSADFETNFNLNLTLGMLATLSLGAVLSYGLALAFGYSPEDRGSFSQGAFRGNLAYVGLPIVLSAYGDAGFTKAGVLMGCLVPAINLLSILALIFARRNRHSSTNKRLLRDQLLCNPLIIGSLVTGATLPLALITIGGSFSLRQLQGDLRKAGLASLFKLAAFPLLNFFVISLFGIHGMDLGIAVLLAGTPTAAASYVLAQELDGNPRLTSSIIILSTTFSAASFTVLLTLLGIAGLLAH
jgi:predicted permease